MRRHDGLEKLLASVLNLGSLLACSIIAVGILLSIYNRLKEFPSATGLKVVTAGVSLLIFLPAGRVALMLCAFMRDRDLLFSGISLLVLVIIILGAALGAA
jgi:uncharacterized membrane protein